MKYTNLSSFISPATGFLLSVLEELGKRCALRGIVGCGS